MSIPIITSASNTTCKALRVVDHGINTTDRLAEMLYDQVNLAFIESKKEVFTEANKAIKDDNLTDEQVKYLQSLY